MIQIRIVAALIAAAFCLLLFYLFSGAGPQVLVITTSPLEDVEVESKSIPLVRNIPVLDDFFSRTRLVTNTFRTILFFEVLGE